MTIQPMQTGSPRRSYADQARSLLRDVALDAAVELVRMHGWAHTRMEDIAKMAGVSKPTLYKSFGSREQLAGAYLDREVDTLLAVAHDALDKHPDDPQRALETGVRAVLTEAAENPLMRAVLSDDDAGASLLPLLTTHSDRLLTRATDNLDALLQRRFGPVDPADSRAYADTMIRVLISHAILPGPSIDDSLDTILRMATPILNSELAAAERDEPAEQKSSRG